MNYFFIIIFLINILVIEKIQCATGGAAAITQVDRQGKRKRVFVPRTVTTRAVVARRKIKTGEAAAADDTSTTPPPITQPLGISDVSDDEGGAFSPISTLLPIPPPPTALLLPEPSLSLLFSELHYISKTTGSLFFANPLNQIFQELLEAYEKKYLFYTSKRDKKEKKDFDYTSLARSFILETKKCDQIIIPKNKSEKDYIDHAKVLAAKLKLILEN